MKIEKQFLTPALVCVLPSRKYHKSDASGSILLLRCRKRAEVVVIQRANQLIHVEVSL